MSVVELNCIAKGVGVIQGIGDVFLSLLVLVYSFHDSSKLHHDLLHPLEQLLVVVTGLIGHMLH